MACTTGWAVMVFIQEKLRITIRELVSLKKYTHIVGCYLTKKSYVDEEKIIIFCTWKSSFIFPLLHAHKQSVTQVLLILFPRTYLYVVHIPAVLLPF